MAHDVVPAYPLPSRKIMLAIGGSIVLGGHINLIVVRRAREEFSRREDVSIQRAFGTSGCGCESGPSE